jgi:redox-sensitive bicupin YhaK (pirin superfamily)
MSHKIIKGRKRDLGGFAVARSLPSAQRKSVGPFVFLDHMGPLQLDEHHFVNVRPHPHIGLSTVTYLFEGRFFHRDSLGTRQIIKPGELNWMTAGSGIVHSERTPEDILKNPLGHSVHGVQIWVALPKEKEIIAPEFRHYSENQLPEIVINNEVKGRLMIGEYGGLRSPVRVHSRMFFAEFISSSNSEFKLSIKEKERAVFLVEGKALVNSHQLEVDDLYLLEENEDIKLSLQGRSRIIIIGGEPFPEPRFIWWNFVATDKNMIHEAAKRWQNQEMGQVIDETEFIPLPKDPLP